jgi:hypothetical protein
VNQAEPQLIARTKETWQPRALCPLSDEDAREIAENVTGFFKLLMEWEAKDNEATLPEADHPYYAMSA